MAVLTYGRGERKLFTIRERHEEQGKAGWGALKDPSKRGSAKGSAGRDVARMLKRPLK